MNQMQIGDHTIGPGHPTYIVAELSANHNQSFDGAVKLVHAAKAAGADAIKLQTYTADTLTIRSNRDCFRIGGGTAWDGKTLYELYGEAYTPWEWHPRLKEVANSLQMDLFSTPFDRTSLAFLEQMGVPAYKIASFELVDTPFIDLVARTRKPIIMSTGMAKLEEINDAVEAARGAGANSLALLKCTSAYPAPPDEANLRTISDMVNRFDVVGGLSDHTLGVSVPIAAVVLGAQIVEKHFTLSRAAGGPDSSFSLEPDEFKMMVDGIRSAERALGAPSYGPTKREEKSLIFRRSLFVVKSVSQGEVFTSDNVRSIRPASGLPPKHLQAVLGRRAATDIDEGTPLEWSHIQHE